MENTTVEYLSIGLEKGTGSSSKSNEGFWKYHFLENITLYIRIIYFYLFNLKQQQKKQKSRCVTATWKQGDCCREQNAALTWQRQHWLWKSDPDYSSCHHAVIWCHAVFAKSVYDYHSSKKSKDLYSKVYKTCGIKIFEDDTRSAVLCRSCVTFLDKMDQFIWRAQSVDNTLRVSRALGIQKYRNKTLSDLKI